MIIVQVGNGEGPSKGEKNVHGHREYGRILGIPPTPWRHPVEHMKHPLPLRRQTRAVCHWGQGGFSWVGCSIVCWSLGDRIASCCRLLCHFPANSQALRVGKGSEVDAIIIRSPPIRGGSQRRISVRGSALHLLDFTTKINDVDAKPWRASDPESVTDVTKPFRQHYRDCRKDYYKVLGRGGKNLRA